METSEAQEQEQQRLDQEHLNQTATARSLTQTAEADATELAGYGNEEPTVIPDSSTSAQSFNTKDCELPGLPAPTYTYADATALQCDYPQTGPHSDQANTSLKIDVYSSVDSAGSALAEQKSIIQEQVNGYPQQEILSDNGQELVALGYITGLPPCGPSNVGCEKIGYAVRISRGNIRIIAYVRSVDLGNDDVKALVNNLLSNAEAIIGRTNPPPA